MLETSEKLARSCIQLHLRVYSARQTREIYHVLSYSADFKTAGSFAIHWVRQYLVNVFYLENRPINT